MHFSQIVTLAMAATASGMVVRSTPSIAGAAGLLAIRQVSTCPSSSPEYCGWFNQAANEPPACVPTCSPSPPPMPEPSCPFGEAAYCAADPGHFCPYEESNPYCQDTGTNHCGCYDACADAATLESLLGEIFCPLEKAVAELGLGCLLGGPGACQPGWVDLPGLACTVEELLQFTVGAVTSLVDDVLCLVGEVVGIL